MSQMLYHSQPILSTQLMKTIEIDKKELIQISEENSKSIAYSVLLDISRKNLTDTEFFNLTIPP